VKARSRQLRLGHICAAQVAVEKARCLHVRGGEFSPLEVRMIEEDPFAFDHAEARSVEPHVGEGDVLHPGQREQRARQTTSGERHPGEGGLFHVGAGKVTSFHQDVGEAEVVEIRGRE